MILMLSINETYAFFEEYLSENSEEVIYCIDEKLYQKLLRNGLCVEMIYLKGGVFYTPLRIEYDGLVVTNLENIYKLFEKYNKLQGDNQKEDFKVFSKRYNKIMLQKDLLE